MRAGSLCSSEGQTMSDSFGIVIPRETAQVLLATPEVRRRFKAFMKAKLSEFLRVFAAYFADGLGIDTLRLRFQGRHRVVILRVYIHGLCRFTDSHSLNLRVVATLYCQWFLNEVRNHDSTLPRRGTLSSQLLYDIQTCD